MTAATGRFSLRRLLAEALACLDYRRFQSRYWELRSKDVVGRYAFTEDLPLLEALARKLGAASVVELGCGSGRTFEAYAKASVRQITGLELAPAMLALARARASELKGTDISVLEHDIREAPPSELRCDLVTSTRVLQHIHPRDISRTLSNLVRLQPKAIYLNEGLEPTRLAYLFRHDYEELLKPFGYVPAERGTVPTIDYEYLLFIRKG